MCYAGFLVATRTCYPIQCQQQSRFQVRITACVYDLDALLQEQACAKRKADTPSSMHAPASLTCIELHNKYLSATASFELNMSVYLPKSKPCLHCRYLMYHLHAPGTCLQYIICNRCMPTLAAPDIDVRD